MSGIPGMGEPQDIKSAVPNVDELAQQAIDQSRPAPELPAMQQPAAVPQAPERPSLDDIYAQTMQQSQRPSLDDIYAQSIGGSGDQEGAEAPGILERNLTPSGIAGQVRDLPARAKASFGVTDNEKLASLQQSFGDKNVRKVKDGFMVKDGDKWRRFDTNSGLLDLLANNARPVAEGAMGAPVLAAGVAAAPELGPEMIPIARGAAGALGHLGGDAIQQALGIPRDPARNAGTEAATYAGANMLFGAAGDKISSMFGFEAANKAADFAAEMKASAPKTADQSVLHEAQETLASVDRLAQEHGIGMPVTQQSAFPRDNVTASEMNAAGGTKTAQNFYEQAGEKLKDGWQKVIDYVGDVTGNTGVGAKTMKEAANLDKAEGALIGNFRDMAEKTAGDQELPVNKFQQALSDVIDDFGYKKDGDKLVAPSIDDVKLKGIVLKRQADLFLTKMQKLQESMVNGDGKMTYSNMLGQYKMLTEMINAVKSANSSETKYFSTMVTLKNGLRDDINGWTGNLLQKFDPEAGAEYAKSLARFGNIKDAHEALGSLIDKESISTEALASKLFNKNSLPQLKAMQTLIEHENPQQWRDLVGGYFKSLQTTNTDARGVVNWTAVKDKVLNGLGKDGIQQVWGDDGPQLMNDFLTNAAKISKQQVDSLNQPASQGALKQLLASATRLAHNDPTGAITLLKSVMHDYGIEKYYSKVSVEKLVAGLDPAKRPLYSKVINGMVDSLGQVGKASMNAQVPQSIAPAVMSSQMVAPKPQ